MVNRKFIRGPKGGMNITRSWNQLYCVLSSNRLLFFKDQMTAAKAAQTGGGQYTGRMTYKSEAPLDLNGCQCDVATDYTKRGNVFRLKLNNGAEYLIQAANQQDMTTWVQKLKKLSGIENGSVSSSTMDHNTSSTSENKKSRSLFRKNK